MQQGLHHQQQRQEQQQQQQLVALLSAALPKDDSTATATAAAAATSASTSSAAKTTNSDNDNESSASSSSSRQLAALNSLHRAILFPPNSLLLSHSASFLSQGFSQLLSDKYALDYFRFLIIVNSIDANKKKRNFNLDCLIRRLLVVIELNSVSNVIVLHCYYFHYPGDDSIFAVLKTHWLAPLLDHWDLRAVS